MINETCNGWTNYATWRVNLELIDSGYYTEVYQGVDAYDLSEIIKSDLELYIEDTSEADSIAQSYALAFISNVNWYEIAEHITNDKG